MTETNNNPMSDADIVTGLRSNDLEERTAAMDALFPGPGGALLIAIGALKTETSSTATLDVGRAWLPLLQVMQNLGAHVGLKLDWVPNQQQPHILTPGELMR